MRDWKCGTVPDNSSPAFSTPAFLMVPNSSLAFSVAPTVVAAVYQQLVLRMSLVFCVLNADSGR